MSSNNLDVPVSRVVIDHLETTLPNKTVLSGRLEHFAAPRRVLCLFPEDNLQAPVPLTVSLATIKENPDLAARIATLANDEVVLCDWLELNGAAETLAELGLIKLNERFEFGAFHLRAYIARVL